MAATTDTQNVLAQDAKFIRRLAALLILEAQVVTAESVGTANHAQRRGLAQQILSSPYQTAASFAPVIAMSGNLLAANTTYDFVQIATVTDATDAAIRSQIATLWNTLAGV